MKYKIIKTFFAITFSICIIYGGVRKGYLAAVSYAAGIVNETDNSNLFPDRSEKPLFYDKKHRYWSNTEETPSSQYTEPILEPESDQTLEPSQEIDSPPSLDEYLSTLHCGGCGRNCFLISPHCHNGKRKADNATAEYYAQYSTS